MFTSSDDPNLSSYGVQAPSQPMGSAPALDMQSVDPHDIAAWLASWNQ